MTALSGLITTPTTRAGTLWWTLVGAGCAWIIVGFVVLRFDQATVPIVTVVFGLMILFAAAAELLRAAISSGGLRIWHGIFAILLIAGAILTFANPGPTFVTLGWVAGLYFVVAGTFAIVASLLSTGVANWWIGLLTGIAEVVLGFLASSSYSSSVLLLVTYVSVVAIFRGVSEIASGFALRRIDRSAS